MSTAVETPRVCNAVCEQCPATPASIWNMHVHTIASKCELPCKFADVVFGRAFASKALQVGMLKTAASLLKVVLEHVFASKALQVGMFKSAACCTSCEHEFALSRAPRLAACSSSHLHHAVWSHEFLVIQLCNISASFLMFSAGPCQEPCMRLSTIDSNIWDGCWNVGGGGDGCGDGGSDIVAVHQAT